MKPLELLYYLFAILGGLGSFIGGISNLAVGYQTMKRGTKMGKTKSSKSAATLIIGCVLIGICAVVISGILLAKDKYKNEQLIAESWNAFNDGKYERAIEKAKECIIEFQEEALRQERELRDSKAPQPPIGETTAEKTREIVQRGLLNDVATGWVIIGMSERKLGHKEKAISAFSKASQFSYARTYDPSWKGFWSPAEKAKDYIKSLQQELY
jgi:hypothetical protein